MTAHRYGLLALLCFVVSTTLFAATPRYSFYELPVQSVAAVGINKTDLAFIQKRLGIVIGARLDSERVEEGIRALYSEGKIQSLFLAVEPEAKGLRIELRGGIVKRLRKLSLLNLDSDIWSQAQKGLSPVQEGKNIDSRVLSLLKNRIKQGYESKGYFFPEVETRLTESQNPEELDVEIIAKPGEPTRVEQIRVGGGTPRENGEIKEVIPMRRGDKFTRGLLDESIEVISKYFRSNQYPRSKVDETNINFSEDKRTVDVEFILKVGERYQFQFAGNTVFGNPQIREWVTPEIVGQSDAVNQIGSLIESKYRQVGYHFCKVQIKSQTLPKERLNVVQYRIEEGPKVWIDGVRFNGGTTGMSAKRMQSLFFEGAPGVIERYAYWEAGLPEATNLFLGKLQGLGFLRAAVQAPKVVFSEDKKGVELIIEVELGEQTRISQILFEGVNSEHAEALKQRIPISVGQPLNEKWVDDSRVEILKFYAIEGFSDAKLLASPALDFSDDQKTAVVRFAVQEGVQYFIGSIRVEGNVRTAPRVVTREIKLKPGDKYNQELVRQSEDEIQLLGLFGRVEIIATTSPHSAIQKDLRVLVVEVKPGAGEVGAGGVFEDPRFRARGFLGIAYKNLLGLNQTASARTEVALPISHKFKLIPFVEYSAILGYRAPYLFELPFVFSSQASLDSYEIQPLLDGGLAKIQTRAKIEEKIERKLSKHLTLSYRLHRFERTTTETLILLPTDDPNHPNNPNFPHDPKNVPQPIKREDIGSTGPGAILDFRDDIYNPTKGSYHTLDVEFAHPALLTQAHVGFYMAILRNSVYVPLLEPVGLAFFMGFGYAESLYLDSPLPVARTGTDLSLGGQGSIRGFSPKKFNPEKNVIATGYYNGRVELTSLLFYSISGAVFLDTGRIYSRLNGASWTTGVIHTGVGVGFRYKTPVGPVVVDISQGLGADKEAVKFNFTIGIF